MNKTKIEYLNYTWNPIKMKCTPVSKGCRNCWHLAMAKRLAGNPSIDRNSQTAYMGGPFILDSKELEAPLHLKKPARIGVQFMGDLLHDSIDGFWISAVWGTMQKCPQHTFFLLTKRPERFLKLTPPLPILSNVWFGVSVEDQPTADERIQILLQIPAAHHFISIEPMIGPVDLHYWLPDLIARAIGKTIDIDVTESVLTWCIVGAETGPHARPLHPDWVRSIRDQCQAAGVPFFFKSWGDGIEQGCGLKGHPMHDAGWSRKGHLLDGKELREFPK